MIMSHRRAPKHLFEAILHLLQAQETTRAIESCRAALEQFPDDLNLLGLLGAALGDNDQYREAEQVLRHLIDLAPTFAKPHEDLGLLLMQQAQTEQALPLLQKAVRLDESLVEAQFQLARALAQLGRAAEADAAFERAFELSPERRWLALAAEHHQAGRLHEAERLCRKVLQTRPGQVDALRMLGLIAAAAGDLDDAEHLLRQALKQAPDHTPAIFELGRVLKELDRHEDAIELYQELIQRQPENPSAHYRLAAVQAPAALTAEAAGSYRRCLALKPDHAGAWLGLGHMLKTLGDQDAGIQAYQRCLELAPGFGEAYWSLANLKTYRFSSAELAQMAEQVNSETVTEDSRVNFLFALGKAWEDRGNYARAWHYYQEGNAGQRMLVRYDPVQTESSHDAVIEFFDSNYFNRTSGQGCTDKAPVFILGLPRSGSTLIEQIVASHSQVEGTSELPYIGRLTRSLNHNRADGMQYPQLLAELAPQHLQRLGQEYLQLAARHRVEGRAHFIDKMPNNFPSVGFIHSILPNAKIIDARRHPLDACIANLRQLYARGQTFAYDQFEIGHYYLQYHRMMQHWNTVLPGRVLTVRYEDTVADLETQVRRILGYLELPWEDACLNYHTTERAVRTPSSEQVRRPIYTTGVEFWRNYETYVEDLQALLSPVTSNYPLP